MLLAGPAVAAEPDAAARGAYLAAAAGCDHCHTDAENGGRPYAGGRRMATPFGVIVAPNITPDPATGIGRWSAGDFTRAMRWGVAPDDTRYVPAFPFPYYAGLSARDLADLRAFLDSLPPVPRAPGAAGAMALVERARAALGIAVAPAGPWQPDPAHDTVWNRGAYLVATVGRCGQCHTPHDALGIADPDRFLAGTMASAGGKKAPNITPDAATGIGKWSEDEVLALLKEGQTPEPDFVGGAMGEIVKNTARLTDDDRRAIAVFLRAVPARPFGKKG